MKKIVFEVTETEKQDIKNLYEKKVALENLFNVITEESDVYNNVMNDYIITSKEFSNWWSEVSNKYQYDKNSINKLTIDFDSNEVWYDNEERTDNNV